jgi:prepilin-type processing-associated H-X9-DG protein
MSRPFKFTMMGLAGLVLLACAGLTVPLELLVYLIAGWVLFLKRVVPDVTVDWGGVVLVGVCLALFAGLAHSFLSWLYRQVRGFEPGDWKWKWTGSLVAGVVLMFVAGISAAGIAHQVGWLATSKEPWAGYSMIAARRTQSVLNLKQIGLGLANYESERGSYPPGTSLDAEGRLLHGWQARILPYVEQTELYNQINFSIPWDDPRNEAAFRTRLPVFLNPGFRDGPGTTGPAPSHYSGNAWLLGGDSARKLKDISDGTSNTIMAGEVGAEFKPWGHPANWRDPAKGLNQSPEGFGGPFPGGADFLFADGSVRFLRNGIKPKFFRALATPAGGEALRPEDEY